MINNSILTPKEQHFCMNYINTGNAKEAALMAGFKNPEQKGAELLTDKAISDELLNLYEEKKKNLMYKACVGYERLAFGSIADCIKLLFCENLTPEILSKMDLFNISEIKKPKDGAMEIKFFDRLKALEKLEESDLSQNKTADPFYFALEKGIESLRSGE